MSPDQMKRHARRLVPEVWTKGDFTVAGELGPRDDVDPARRPGLTGLKGPPTWLFQLGALPTVAGGVGA
jgi:hypothetical protein